MKSLLVYLKDYKKESILGPLFKMLEASFELFIPLVVAMLIDTGIRQGERDYIIKMGGVMIFLGSIGLISSITAQYYAAKAAVGFSVKLRHALFSHIQSLSFTELDAIGTSTMITRMTSDINQVQTGVNLVLRLFLRSPFVVFGAMIMAFTVDVKAALIFVLLIPLLSLVVFGIMLLSIPLYKKVQRGLDKLLLITRENLTGVRVIRAFHKEEDEVRKFKENNQSLYMMQMFVGKISALMNPVTYLIINSGIVVLIYAGAFRVDAGNLTQGALVALLNYMSQILVELIKLANLIITVTRSVASAKRIEDIFKIKSSMEMKRDVNADDFLPKQQSDTILSFEGVSLCYKGAGEEALSDIDFQVKKGQTIGIIGGTGSGKTSLVHLIPRFYDATKGSVKLYGRDVKEWDVLELRKRIGIVLQKAVLFEGSIGENLRWGKRDAADKELYQALAAAQADSILKMKEAGLHSKVEQGGKNFSGGQKQRLTIARALTKQPEILILDDSASALDYATDAKLRKEIRHLSDSMTIFIVSQRTASVLHADQIIVLEDGKVAGIGTHETLLAACCVYQEIYRSQSS